MLLTQSMLDTMDKWHTTTDPLYKMMLKDAIDTMRRDLGMAPLPESGIGTGDGDDGTGDETGDGDDEE